MYFLCKFFGYLYYLCSEQYLKITVVAAVAKRKETFFVFKDGNTVFCTKRIKFTLVITSNRGLKHTCMVANFIAGFVTKNNVLRKPHFYAQFVGD